MTPKEFLLKKYPTNIFFDCPVPKEYWKDMQGFSDANNKQLAEQNKELLEACKRAEKHHQGLHSEIGSILRNAIANAEK